MSETALAGGVPELRDDPRQGADAMSQQFSEGPLAILFTDVEGSTDLRNKRGDEVAQQILRAHDEIVKEAARKGDCRQIKGLGDGMMAVFGSVRKAIASAVEIQRDLADYNHASEDVGLSVRIGINAGEVIAEGDELMGAAVNAAHRIAAQAAGGQILVSDVVKQLAGPTAGVWFRDLGRFELKGFPEPWGLHEVVWNRPAEEGTHDASPPIRILVVDDQALVRSGFRMILEAEGGFRVVGEAADGEAAIVEARRLQPDVILMDVRMPNLDGIAATRRMVESGLGKVLILTTFDLDEYLFESVRAGASGFLLKDVPPGDLANAIRVVARGDGLIEPRMTRKLLQEFGRRRPATAHPDPVELLTARELEVFKELAKGLSNSEIAEALFISETTVKSHVAHILTKLGLRDRIQVVVLAHETGLAGEDSE